MDGREYLSTSNFFDLRFIPDETSFDEDTPHDECLDLPQGYKPNDFRTEALTHSKVRLTWDDDDATRKEVQKRAFSRAEMDENDLQAYIGSDDSDADSISSRVSTAEQKRKAKADAKRAKAREAFGLSLEPTKSSKKDKDEVVGDMQITFTSGLSSKKGGDVFENEPQDEESTRQRYIRKEKERKQKRKERAKARNGEEEEEAEAEPGADVDDGFNDPFFNDPTASAAAEKSARKAAKDSKRAAREAADAEAESRRAELELLMADEDGGAQHFDMREIEKAEKAARKKGKNKKGKKSETAEQDDFEVETSDPRFKALFDSHEYAIDPTAPAFKKTKAMQGLLEEKRRKRKGVEEEDEDLEGGRVKKAKKVEDGGNGDDVKGLVARLKDKSKKKAGRA
ncbi:Pre-rRNA-processing protein esf1 [Pseudocercospora fuligena]|uniref:Pre-rRNA-processing protein esf1 n=1 Tax=Pseudocercospora fuligena TaxID=685502 RepID=A0A8H6VNF2_9PEZI|nr:Pre-rRNA-processing protein esf1 [Pseudocercospora fuligena]